MADSVSPFRKILQGVDQNIPLTPRNTLGQPLVLGLQSGDSVRMELRVSLKAAPLATMISPTHFTIVPAAGGNPPQLIIKFFGEETVLWDLPIFSSKEAESEPVLDADGELTLAQRLYGTIFISDTAGNSRPGSGIPAKFAMIPSFTRSAGPGGL